VSHRRVEQENHRHQLMVCKNATLKFGSVYKIYQLKGREKVILTQLTNIRDN
jgi:hypothetical protein